MVHKIYENNQLVAIVVKKDFCQSGTNFFTPDDFSQQLAYIHYPEGKIISPHFHNIVRREVHYTQEVLFIKKGKLRVDIYDENQNYIESCLLEAGDVILLASGGHGFEVIEEIEIIEVKQGPYVGAADKTNF